MNRLNTRIGRRTLLQGAAAMGLVGASGRPLRAQAARGGTLVIAAPGAGAANTLDPRSFNSPYMAILGGTIYNTLTEVEGPRAELKPGLATAWTASDGGATWAFDLVAGATFHDGRPVRAADVIYSYGLHVAEGSRSNSRAIIGAVAEMVAESDSRLTLRLRAPNWFFPAQLSNFNLCILPEGSDPASGIGSGPYRVTRFAPGEILEAARHDGYFKTDRAHVDAVELLAVNDPAARTSAVQSGEAHVVTLVDARTAPLLQGLPGHTLHNLPGSGFNGVNMRVDAAPFDALALRQAIKAAVNRQDIITRVFNGFAQPGNDHPVPPSSRYFDAAGPQWAHDPDRARALYAESGHSGPLLLQTSDAVQGGIDVATLIAEHARAAGIEITVQREPADGYWSNVWAKAPFHGSMWAARPTEDMILALAYGSGSPANDTGFANADYDAAVAAARATEDTAARAGHFATAQRILSAEGGAVIPLFVEVIEAVSTELTGYVGGTSPTFRVAEMVSFA
jgi:peptide/nickel transport system substrate-binding protein